MTVHEPPAFVDRKTLRLMVGEKLVLVTVDYEDSGVRFSGQR
jgi:hypothetical protein